jgi:hypothetical protein
MRRPHASALALCVAVGALAAVVAIACETNGGASGDGGLDAADDSSNDAAADVTSCFFCGDGGTDDASVPQRVFDRLLGCNGVEPCHCCGAAGLTYPSDDPTRLLINVKSTEMPSMVRVKPYDPLASYLYLKVRGDGGIDGTCMPQGNCPDPVLEALFYEWIEAGAQGP